MASETVVPSNVDGILTTEQFMDLLCSKSPSELTGLQLLRVKAYPFPLYPSEDASAYTTYCFEDLLPLFPGLALQSLNVHDAFHGPDVGEDGWGHNTTYNSVGGIIKTGKGWKELVFESMSDRWLEPVCFITRTRDGNESEKVHGRDPQPHTWDEMIKARDGSDSGAGVEMWFKEARKGSEWVKVDDHYKSSFVENENNCEDGEEGLRPAIKVCIKRGNDADYEQDGYKSLDKKSWGMLNGLYEIFEKGDWAQIKRDLFIPGAEEDPTAHL